MADNLTGKKIKDTYQGLIKTNDNGPLGATASPLSDGLGNELPLSLSLTETIFSGSVNFSGATVSGLSGLQGPQGPAGVQGFQGPAGTNGVNGTQGFQGPQGPAASAGLIAGSAANSMASSPALTLNPATASNTNTIALGNGARALEASAIAFGLNALADAPSGVVIGDSTLAATAGQSNRNNIVTIGRASRGAANSAVVGADNLASNQHQHLIGNNLRGNASFYNINVGSGTNLSLNGDYEISIGYFNVIGGLDTIAIGRGITASNAGVVAMGQGVVTGGSNGVAIGANARSNANGVTIGPNATVGTTGPTTVVGSSVSGSGPAASAFGAEASAGGEGAVALGYRAVATGNYSIGISRLSNASGLQSIAIGYISTATAANAVSLGFSSNATAAGAVALGRDLDATTVDTTTTRRLQLIDTVAMNYVDDAAAATAGVPVGGIYHTAGTLKIRLT